MLETLLGLGLVMGKLGLLAFGSTAVVLADMEREVVGRGWLTPSQFVEAYALGQLAPGPGSLYVVAVGYYAAGFAGAIVALAAHLGPPAIVAALAARLWHRAQASPWSAAVRTGLTPLAVGLILASAYTLARSSVRDVSGLVVLLVVLALFMRTSLSTPLVLLGAAASGALFLRA